MRKMTVLAGRWSRARGLAASVTMVLAAALLGACAEDDAATPTPARSVATSVSTSKAATAAAPATAATTATAAVTGSPAAAAPAASATTVRVADTALGKVLVDERGLTLYTFQNDPPNEGKSTCNGPCAALWLPLAAPGSGSPTKPPELPGPIAVITRDDGSRQVAYAGQPLYRYASDTAPGDTKGEGVGGVWFAARPEASSTGTKGGDPGY